jgi:hypothetical protein
MQVQFCSHRTTEATFTLVLFGLAALACLFLPLGAFAQDQDNTQPNTNQAAIPEIAKSLDDWNQSMRRLKQPPEGCYTAKFPRVEWQSVPCGDPPKYPMLPPHGPPGHFVVGNGGANDYAARVTGNISASEGTFVSVSAGITESGPIANTGPAVADAYTLQINTNPFAGAACAGSPNVNCQGWEQFVYENNNTEHRVFIQYWLLRYNANCPAGGGWTQFSFSGGTDIYCYQSTTTASLPAGQPVSNLGNMTLGAAVSATSDQVTITAGTNMATRVGVNAVAASAGWTDSEFNIFGDGGNASGGGQASFGANTTLVVRTTVHSGTTAAPTCRSASFTGETNNLDLVGMAPIGMQPAPAIEFTESNVPGTARGCVVAQGAGDTHLMTFGGLLYDFQATGDFLLARTDNNFMVQTRQVSGAPNWPNASVNRAVAAKMGKTEIAFCSAEAGPILINGRRKNIGDGDVLSLPGNVGVKRVGNVYLLVDGRGNSVRAELNANHINVSVGLGRWPTRVLGILANAGSADKISTRGGAVLTAPFAFSTLYGKFADSWRVSRGESLLRVCGKAKEAGAPKKPFTPKDLNPEDFRKAQGICREAGIEDQDLLEACMIDVTMIGDKGAAQVFTRMPKPLVVGRIQ